MKNNSGIVWLHLFLLAFPTTLFFHRVEGKRSGLVLDLLQNGKLAESLNLKNVFRGDPIAKLEIEPLVRHFGYPIEVHRFYAPDGYVTTLHRIPHGRNSSTRGGPPVLIMHGFLSSAISWLHSDEDSLPFLLADQGYDVFIASQRGSGYSLGHKTLKVTDNAYWRFGLDEIASIEYPAYVDYILALTGAPRTHYVGFSLATVLCFTFLAMRPEYNDKIDRISLMGPGGYFSHTQSPLFRILRVVGPKAFQGVADLAFSGGFDLPSPAKLLLGPLCRLALGPLVCGSVLFLLTGDDVAHMNQTRVGRALAHLSSASGKAISHMLQWIKSARFAKFDYGQVENMKRYGSPIPPEYDLKNVQRPVQAHLGRSDKIVTLIDGFKTLKGIGPYHVNPTTCLVQDPSFNHFDFMINDNIVNLVYRHVIKFFATGVPYDNSPKALIGK